MLRFLGRCALYGRALISAVSMPCATVCALRRCCSKTVSQPVPGRRRRCCRSEARKAGRGAGQTSQGILEGNKTELAANSDSATCAVAVLGLAVVVLVHLRRVKFGSTSCTCTRSSLASNGTCSYCAGQHHQSFKPCSSEIESWTDLARKLLSSPVYGTRGAARRRVPSWWG